MTATIRRGLVFLLLFGSSFVSLQAQTDSTSPPLEARIVCFEPASRNIPSLEPGTHLEFQGEFDRIRALSISPDGQRVATGDSRGTLQIWNVPDGREICRWKGQIREISSVAFSPDGRRLASGGGDGVVEVWDLEARQQRAVFRGHHGRVHAVVFSPDGTLVTSLNSRGTLILWRPGDSKALWRERVGRRVGPAVFSADGRHLLVAHGRTMDLWRIDAGVSRLRTFTGHRDTILSVALSSDAALALSGSDDHTVRVWEGRTGRSRHVLTGHKGSITAVASSPDGQLGLSGVFGDLFGELRLWKLDTGVALTAYTPTPPDVLGDVTALQFLPEGTSAVGGGMGLFRWRLPAAAP